jgi:uroporphyrinogen-III synthase
MTARSCSCSIHRIAMADLRGSRIAVLDGRMSGEMASLVRRYGGDPLPVPTVRESGLDCSVAIDAFVRQLSHGSFEVVVFLTGAGARALFAEADRLGRLPELLAGLARVATVCRGPKPSAALRRAGIPVAISAGEPYTTEETLAAMARLDLAGRGVAVVHYGERNADIAAALRARDAHVEELSLYEWQLPEDTAPMRDLVRTLIGGGVDAITFTSQVQARHLFLIATEMGLAQPLTDALNEGVIVASVAPTCAAALRNLGVEPRVIPEHPKMGHLVRALAEYVERETAS